MVSLQSQRRGLYRLCVAHQLMYSFGGMSAYIGLRLFSFKFLFIVKIWSVIVTVMNWKESGRKIA